MAPTPRAQKKRKTDSASAAASAAAPAPEDKEPETGGGVAPPTDKTDDDDDDDDKYASAEPSSGDEGDEDEYSESSGDDSDDSISSLVAAQHEQQKQQNKKKRKRHDPEAFSTSMSKILSSHLTTTARKDPVLVRAKQTADHVDDGKLEAKARRAMKEELRKEREKGRIRDLVPKGDDAAAGQALERERMLKRIARSGVARLYNAVRAAQIKGEEAAKGVQKEGLVGMGNREAKVTEMSKQGFLDLIQSTK